MRAIVVDGFGANSAIREAEVPTPVPGPGEVRVRITHASVNPADWKMHDGWLTKLPIFKPSFPFVLGYDGAGIIDSVGPGVENMAPGTRVMVKSDQSQGKWGSYAEYLVVGAEMAGAIPDNLPLAEAATIPVAGLTAWHGIFLQGGLQPGQTILVHGAAGGVGSFAVQFARAAGARVLASCSAANADYVRSHGAEGVFDTRDGNTAAVVAGMAPGGVDIIFDAVGRNSLPEALALIRPGGTLVRVPTLGDDDQAGITEQAAQASGRQLIRSSIVRSETQAAYRAIGDLYAAGKMVSPEVQMLPIGEIAQALALSKAGHVRGKLVLALWGIGD